MQIFLAIAGICIALFSFKLNKQKYQDSWLETYRIIHETFWNDEAYKKYRQWLSCDRSYGELRKVLIKRKKIAENEPNEQAIRKNF